MNRNTGKLSKRQFTHTVYESWSAVNNWTATYHLYYSEKVPDAVRLFGKNGWVSRCQENSYSSSSEWLEKADRMSSHLLVGHLLAECRWQHFWGTALEGGFSKDYNININMFIMHLITSWWSFKDFLNVFLVYVCVCSYSLFCVFLLCTFCTIFIIIIIINITYLLTSTEGECY